MNRSTKNKMLDAHKEKLAVNTSVSLQNGYQKEEEKEEIFRGRLKKDGGGC